METKNKIDKILNEIELPYYKNLTAQQIIDNVLNKDIHSSVNENIQNGRDQKYKLDIETLLSFANKNNQLQYIDYYHPLNSNRPVVAKLLIFFRKIIRKILKFLFEPILNQQNRFNRSITDSINALFNNELVTQNFIDNTLNQFIDLNKSIQNLKSQILELKNRFTISDNQISELKNKFTISDNQISELKNKLAIFDNQILELNHNLYHYFNNIKQDHLLLNNQLDYMSFKIHQLNNNYNNNVNVNKTDDNNIAYSSNIDNKNAYQSIDYFDFENHFRGIRDNIKNNQKDYIQYFINKKNVLDLGCGRGEFLELLKENGINAIGIDLYKDFVDYCIFKDLKAINDDIINYLLNLNDNSIDGIFCSQVVEHLTTDQIVSLCNIAYKKLQNDSYIIIETPNPTSLSMYTSCFYIDPSHIKPIHPKTLEYFLYKAGFKDIQTIYTEQSKVNYRLPLLESQNVNNLSDFNHGINLLSDIIFGSQDYAIIARK